jgi:hypothetical protein
MSNQSFQINLISNQIQFEKCIKKAEPILTLPFQTHNHGLRIPMTQVYFFNFLNQSCQPNLLKAKEQYAGSTIQQVHPGGFLDKGMQL